MTVRSISLSHNDEQRLALSSRRVYRTAVTAAEKHEPANRMKPLRSKLRQVKSSKTSCDSKGGFGRPRPSQIFAVLRVWLPSFFLISRLSSFG